jgi:hypothetical protein
LTEDTYSVDAPPDRTLWEFDGTLVESRRLNNADEADAAGAGENYRKYMETAGRSLDSPVWFLKAVGLSIGYKDGTDYLSTDILALKDKKGRWLTKGQAPDQVATQFREKMGFSAAAESTGAANSAVGKAFHFVETELKLGKGGFTKNVSLFPVAHIADPSQIAMDRSLEPKSAQGSEATPEAPPDASLEEAALIASAIVGATRSEVFQRVMNTPALKGIARIGGHDLIAAATEDRLPDILIGLGVLAEVDGRLVAANGASGQPTAVPA